MDAIDLLPEPQRRDALAIRSMSATMEAESDIKVRKDLGNRIAQCMGRLADWEDQNPELGRQIAEAARAA